MGLAYSLHGLHGFRRSHIPWHLQLLPCTNVANMFTETKDKAEINSELPCFQEPDNCEDHYAMVL